MMRRGERWMKKINLTRKDHIPLCCSVFEDFLLLITLKAPLKTILYFISRASSRCQPITCTTYPLPGVFTCCLLMMIKRRTEKPLLLHIRSFRGEINLVKICVHAEETRKNNLYSAEKRIPSTRIVRCNLV